MTDWTLVWDPRSTDLGVTDWAARTITMRPGGSQAQRRSTLAHELAHVERGPVLDDPVLAAREDRRCDVVAARSLVDLPRLVDALRWSHSWWEVAQECWVDMPTLRARIEHLTAEERDLIEGSGPYSPQL